MYCDKTITHIVKPGDTLYQLARCYQTTVPDILLNNPGTNPYNLQIGSKLLICQVDDKEDPKEDIMELTNDMRFEWLQHGYLVRSYLVSVDEGLKDKDEIAKKLEENVDNIVSIFSQFYPQTVSRQLRSLLIEHVSLGGEYMTSLKNNDTKKAEMILPLWYENATKIAELLSKANPKYNEKELQKMLFMHLDLEKQEINERLSGNYVAEMNTFIRILKQLLVMSDYLVSGIIKQFYTSPK